MTFCQAQAFFPPVVTKYKTMWFPRNSRQNWKILFPLSGTMGLFFPWDFLFKNQCYYTPFYEKKQGQRAAKQSRCPINNSIFLQVKTSKTQNGRNGSKTSTDSHKMLKICFLFQNFHFLFSVFPSANTLFGPTQTENHLGIGLALSCFGLGLCPGVTTGCLYPQLCSVHAGY